MMKTTLTSIAATFAVALSTLAVAPVAAKTTVVQCVDANGEVTWQDACLPGQTEVGRQKLYTGESRNSDRLAASAIAPIRFYTVSACESCDLIRAYLQALELPYEELDLETDVAAQTTLQGLLGRLVAPVVSVGSDVVEGYDRARIRALASDAGYPLADDAGPLGGGPTAPQR